MKNLVGLKNCECKNGFGDCPNPDKDFGEKCCISCENLGDCEYECYLIRKDSGELVDKMCEYLKINK